jgi:uncharacterized protein (DUF169 family)
MSSDRQYAASLPVGVRILRSSDEHGDLSVYHGVSYCDAVRRAGEGEAQRLLPGSIQVCGWAPVVLGLKEPAGRFEESLAPRLPFPVAGLLLAPLDRFPGEPDVVMVRDRPQVLLEMATALDRQLLWAGHRGRLDRSALPAYLLRLGPRPPAKNSKRARARQVWTTGVNRMLAVLAQSAHWQAFTHWLFRSRLVTAGFEAVISRTLADMSVCRNSTAIPLLSGRTNLSFFCTGGITWGRNRPDEITSGWPWAHWEQIGQSPVGRASPRSETRAEQEAGGEQEEVLGRRRSCD